MNPLKPTAAQRLTVLVIISLATNLGLAWKVRSQRQQLDGYIANNRRAEFIGDPLTSLPVADLQGKERVLDFKSTGPATVLYIFRPGCVWCAKNLANIKALNAAMRQSNSASIIGLSLTEDGLKDYLQNTQIPFPVYLLTSADIHRFKLGVTPETIVVSKGVIVENWNGAYVGILRKEVEGAFSVKLPGISNVAFVKPTDSDAKSQH